MEGFFVCQVANIYLTTKSDPFFFSKKQINIFFSLRADKKKNFTSQKTCHSSNRLENNGLEAINRFGPIQQNSTRQLSKFTKQILGATA
jgi:hypothetical protein